MSATGIINLACELPVIGTVDRLEALLKAKGIKIFARIDQAAEAQAVGLTMRPTVLLIFGDPKTGTPLMNRYPSIAMDLPLKVLVWESAESRYVLHFGERILPVVTGDAEGDVISLTQQCTSVIESWVRRYPGQWLWIHRRWKTRPDGTRDEGTRD